jgi:hypothetical protein
VETDAPVTTHEGGWVEQAAEQIERLALRAWWVGVVFELVNAASHRRMLSALIRVEVI